MSDRSTPPPPEIEQPPLEPTLSGSPDGKNLEGPYYRPESPRRADLAGDDYEGVLLAFRGAVINTNGDSLPGARIELWQADADGDYDNECEACQGPDEEPFAFRGHTFADAEGKFQFRTVVPKNYQVTPSWTRVKHLHFKIYKQCHWPLTTQIYLLPDDYTHQDMLFFDSLATELEDCRLEGNDAKCAEFTFILRIIEGSTPRLGYEIAVGRLPE